jgi:hypothetical protein
VSPRVMMRRRARNAGRRPLAAKRRTPALRTGRRVLAAAGLWLLVLLPLSCTGSPPEILEVLSELRLERNRDTGTVSESLSLFVKPNDPDGSEDLEEMYLIQDQEELFWRLDPDSWSQNGSGADLWIGSNNLRLPDGSGFPAGEYRILLRDASGESAERSISLRALSVSEARGYLPRVSVEAESISIQPRNRDYVLWLYDLSGTFVSAVSIQQGSQPLGPLRASYPALQSGFRFTVYVRIEAQNLGVVDGPYTVAAVQPGP